MTYKADHEKPPQTESFLAAMREDADCKSELLKYEREHAAVSRWKRKNTFLYSEVHQQAGVRSGVTEASREVPFEEEEEFIRRQAGLLLR